MHFAGVDHDARDEPGRRLIYMQMVELMMTLGDKVPVTSVGVSRNFFCLDQILFIYHVLFEKSVN